MRLLNDGRRAAPVARRVHLQEPVAKTRLAVALALAGVDPAGDRVGDPAGALASFGYGCLGILDHLGSALEALRLALPRGQEADLVVVGLAVFLLGDLHERQDFLPQLGGLLAQFGSVHGKSFPVRD